MKIFHLILGVAAICLCSSCEDEKIKEKIDPNGSVEVSYKTEAIGDNQTLLTCTRKVYYHGKEIKTNVYIDTLPSLGDTVQMFEDETHEWSQKVQKQYKFFVTVK